ncbi:MAG TPA: DUF6249 domain-containing protein [Caulobacteraceae bacterium]|nr:DUF6249 domain-containing protein [Caulobacteraceae bacterium]
MTGWIAPTVFWLFVAAIILVPQYLRHMDRQRMHETLRIAYEKGQPVPPELIQALQSNIKYDAAAQTTVPTRERDLRRAVVLIAVGVGLALCGYGLWFGLGAIPGDGGEIASYIVGGSVAGAGAIPGLIGVAYLVLYLTKRGQPTV